MPSPRKVQLSDVVSRLEFAQEHGFLTGYLSNSEIANALGYPDKLQTRDYIYAFRRGGLPATLVDLLPNDTWNAEWDVYEDPDPDVTTKFEAEFQTLNQRLKLIGTCELADILSRLGEYGTILLGLEGDLDQEPKRRKGQGNLLYLAPHPQHSLKIGKVGTNPNTAEYRKPEYYTLEGKYKVHPSRVIHVVDKAIFSPYKHIPSLEKVWNRLEDLERVIGGGALAAWRRADPGIHVSLDPEAELTADQESGLEKGFIEFREKKRWVMVTDGVEKVDMLSSPVHIFAGNADSIMGQIAAISRYPQKHLEGTQTGVLAADQDSKNYWVSVKKRRQAFAQRILREIIDRLIYFGILPQPTEYFVEAQPDNESSIKERTEVGLILAQINSTVGEKVVMPAEIREGLGYEPLEEEDEDSTEDDDDGVIIDDSDDEIDRKKPRVNARFRTVHLARSEYWDVQSAAQESTPQFTIALDRMWESIKDNIQISSKSFALAYSTEVGSLDYERLEQLIDEASREPESQFATDLTSAYITTMESAGNIASKYAAPLYKQNANLHGKLRGLAFQLLFDLTNQKALEWAAYKSSTLITQIGRESRLAIRRLIGEAFQLGIAPKSLAKFITPSIGLRTDQIEAITNLKSELLHAKPGDTITRFNPTPGSKRKVAGFKVKIPIDGPSSSWVNQQVEKYRTMQHNYRGRMIARSETLHAANEGQRQMWGQAVDAGLLPKDVQRVWVSTPRDNARDTHRAMNGQKVGLNEKFERPDGVKIEPGEEVHCGCGQRLDV